MGDRRTIVLEGRECMGACKEKEVLMVWGMHEQRLLSDGEPMWEDRHDSQSNIVSRIGMRIQKPNLSWEGHKLGVRRAPEKPRGIPRHGGYKDFQTMDVWRRVAFTFIISLRTWENSLVVSWIGRGVAYCWSDKAAEPMVGWKCVHPPLVGLDTNCKHTSNLCALCNWIKGMSGPYIAFLSVYAWLMGWYLFHL